MEFQPRFATDSVGGAQLWRPSDQKLDGWGWQGYQRKNPECHWKKEASSMQSLPSERERYHVLCCATHRGPQEFRGVFDRLQQHSILAELNTADRVDEKRWCFQSTNGRTKYWLWELSSNRHQSLCYCWRATGVIISWLSPFKLLFGLLRVLVETKIFFVVLKFEN